jgi:hypothetical protein
MGIKRAAVIGLVLLGAFGPGCSDDEDANQPILVVQAASEQPGADALGVIVAIQSRGGAWLEVQVSGGTLANGAQGTCLRAPSAASLRENVVNVLVFPARIEAVVTVSLLPDGPRVAELEAGTGVAGTLQDQAEAGPCGLDVVPLKQVIRPVQRVSPLPPTSGGAPGTAGVGGNAAAGMGATAGGGNSAGIAGDAGSGGSTGVAGAAGDNGEGGTAGSPGSGGGIGGGTGGVSGKGGGQ